MAKKKVTILLACTYGDKQAGDTVSVDAATAAEMKRHGMAEDVPRISGNGTSLEMAAMRERLDELNQRLLAGGAAFDGIVASVLKLDPSAKNLPAQVETLQKSLGESGSVTAAGTGKQ
jgi:hypothetical protein